MERTPLPSSTPPFDPSATAELRTINTERITGVLGPTPLPEGPNSDTRTLETLRSTFVWEGFEDCRVNGKKLVGVIQRAWTSGTIDRLAQAAADDVRASYATLISNRMDVHHYVGIDWFRDIKPRLQIAGMLQSHTTELNELLRVPTSYEILGTTRDNIFQEIWRSGRDATVKLLLPFGAGDDRQALIQAETLREFLTHWSRELGLREKTQHWESNLRSALHAHLDDEVVNATLTLLQTYRSEGAPITEPLRALGEAWRKFTAPQPLS